MSTPRPPVVVAIPAKNEAERLPACLAALDRQIDAPPLHVVLLLNNSDDASEAIANHFARHSRMTLHVQHRVLSPHQASAGVARHLAMQVADGLIDAGGALLTTDADSVAPPDWIAANLRALAHADAVAGRAVIDPVEAQRIPAFLHEADARECRYALLLDEIAHFLDPDVADPWPRHDEHSGASICVRVPIFRAAGGIPQVASSEDRAFFRALRQIDARVRHAPDVWVTVSGRIEGRAEGGMAETIRRRMVTPDLWLDDRLEPVAAAARRARLRRRARLVHAGIAMPCCDLARALMLPPHEVRDILASGSFGSAWEHIEARSPSLRRRHVSVASVAVQTNRAAKLLVRLRRAKIDPGDIPQTERHDRRAGQVLSPA